MGEILTNSTFVTEINKIITKLGGTPSDISLTPDQANDIVNNSVFASKMDEVIQGYNGIPTVITLSDDEANDMVNKEVFSNKIDELSGVISRGGDASNQRTTLTGTMATIADDINEWLGTTTPDNFLAWVRLQTITMWLIIDATALSLPAIGCPLYAPIADILVVTAVDWSEDNLAQAMKIVLDVSDGQFVLDSMGTWDGTGTYTDMAPYASYITYKLIMDFHLMPLSD